jgi:hypothetical protein
MSANFDFISVTDKPALLALSSPDWQDAARTALVDLGYKVHQAAAHGDFITNFSQVAYEVVVMEENFAADNAPDNRSLNFLYGAQMHLRRHATIILVGDSFNSFDPLQAFQFGVHLVANRSEISLFSQFIQRAVGDNELFLHPYREAQRRLTVSGPAARTA